MRLASRSDNSRSWNVGALAIALTAGFLAGTAAGPPPAARADVRRTQPREAFQAGSERNESVLREIAATLNRIDSRVERIEKSLSKGQ